MTQTETREHSLANALAWFQSIKEMVEALREDADIRTDSDAARDQILESVLSVEVRSGWYSPAGGNADSAPAEFRILLTTGGPACQLVGELNEHGEPETARLEHQDWGTPWTMLPASRLADALDRTDYDEYCVAKREIDETPLEFTSWQEFNRLASVEKPLATIERVDACLLDFARQFYFGEG